MSQINDPLITTLQEGLISGHEWSGLPWWLMIGLGTVVVRTYLITPIVIWQTKLMAAIDPERDWSDQAVGKLALCISIIRGNLTCAPFTITSLALWNIAGYDPNAGAIQWTPAPGIASESLLWMPHLAAPDSFYVLPLLLFITNYLNVVVLHADHPVGSTGIKKLTSWQIGSTASLLVSLVATQLPAIVSLFWLSSASTALGVNTLLKRPSVREKLHIQKNPSDLSTPVFKHFWRSFVHEQKRRPWK